ncbi:MAG: hypothetical protein JXB14_05850 [Candidatus Altiarchaeota archaeon]|nr:hypothetical protein [Candidatus Altiarchaeota archaeon]
MADLIFIGLLIFALFVLFLMFSSGRRRHELIAAMTKLQTQRLQLKKNIEHVKLAEKQGKITEREALTHKTHFETELAEVERRLIELKEKPLGRTLKLQQAREQVEEVEGEIEEAIEAEAAEKVLMSKLDTNIIMIGFAALILIVVFVVINMENVDFLSPTGGAISVSLEAATVPEGGTFPGGSAGLRAYIKNNGGEPIRDIIMTAEVPEESGLYFQEGHLAYKRIVELEANGLRDVFIPLNVGKGADEGEYVITIKAATADGKLETTAKTTLKVSTGSRDEFKND